MNSNGIHYEAFVKEDCEIYSEFCGIIKSICIAVACM